MTVRTGVQHNSWVQPHIRYRTSVGTGSVQFRKAAPYVLAVVLVAATVLFALSCKSSTVSFRNGTRLSTLDIEVADSPQEITTGLMNRKSLPANSGMLFDFGKDVHTSFWMKNTSIPLSIAFIDADGKVLSIQDMKPYDLTSINPPGRYRYAIEVNRGWFDANGVTPGAVASIDP